MNNETKEKIKRLLGENDLIIFIKGTPEEPQCGFTSKLIQTLSKNNIKFSYFNVFDDEEIRQGIKEYGEWPTLPQVYKDGKLIGGCDIILDLDREGKLGEVLG